MIKGLLIYGLAFLILLIDLISPKNIIFSDYGIYIYGGLFLIILIYEIKKMFK
jgi:hypothetical protein